MTNEKAKEILAKIKRIRGEPSTIVSDNPSHCSSCGAGRITFLGISGMELCSDCIESFYLVAHADDWGYRTARLLRRTITDSSRYFIGELSNFWHRHGRLSEKQISIVVSEENRYGCIRWPHYTDKKDAHD